MRAGHSPKSLSSGVRIGHGTVKENRLVAGISDSNGRQRLAHLD
jgi:hypothetical protein